MLSFEKLKALRERKLTTEEADFSEEHLSIVWWFLNEKKLPADDWFDVVVLRYLLTVKRWFTLPELQRYSFTTLAVSTMKSAVNTAVSYTHLSGTCGIFIASTGISREF